MVAGKDRAEKGLQRERVFVHKAEILTLLDQGARHTTIKAKLGLEDVPRSTFQYLVNRIRHEAANRSFLEGHPGSEAMPSPSPASGATNDAEAEDNARTTASKALQSVREAPEAASVDKPKKPTRRKIRKGVVIPESRDAKDLNLDPAKWKKS